MPNLLNPSNNPAIDDALRRGLLGLAAGIPGQYGDIGQGMADLTGGLLNAQLSALDPSGRVQAMSGNFAPVQSEAKIPRAEIPYTSNEFISLLGGDPSDALTQAGTYVSPGVEDLIPGGKALAAGAGLLGTGVLKGRRVADDVARVNFPEDVHFPPELTRKSVGKGGRIPGAPEHVKTVKDEDKILEDYLSNAEAGKIGRRWYDQVAERIDRDTGNISGARPGAADQSAGLVGAFSPRATLEANRLAQVRAINQNATGLPVAAGMGPRNKSAQGLLDESHFGDAEAFKVGLFSRQVRGLGGARGVHDTRDIASWGLPRDLSPGVANHRWMDSMADRAVDMANERKLGGFDDWTHERLQAARWVKDKADEQGIDVTALKDEFGPADDFLRANVFSEAIPSGELIDGGLLGDDARRAYTADFQRQLSNPEGQNALAQQQGLLAPEQTRFVGEWEGATNPNVVTTILADPAKGADVMSDWSREAIEFHGALEGMLGGQADVATSFLRKSKRAGDINAARIPFDRAVTEQDLTSYSAALRKAMREDDIPGDVIGNYRSGKELEVTWLPPDGLEGSDLTKAGKKFRSAVNETSGGRSIEARNSGGLLTYEDEFKPSAYLEHLQNPTQRASVKEMLPKIAGDLESTIKALPLTDKGREIYGKTLSLIKSGGLEAVEDAVKQGILPAAILGALLAANQAPQQPAPSQGLL